MFLVTGSEGLIGRAFCRVLDSHTRLYGQGADYRACDLKTGADITVLNDVVEWMEDCDGAVHLAAYTRVGRCERNPDAAWAANATGVAHLAGVCAAAGKWLVLASSREVYGQQDEFPVSEDAEMRPKNVYAETKVEAERQVRLNRAAGQIANIIRFSNVYGDVDDHPDRVCPAFAKAAARGGELILDGQNTTLDLVHVDDVAEGLWRMVGATRAGELLPPVHLVSGVGTTVSDIASLAMAERRNLKITLGKPRPYCVDKFIGNPERALKLLGWKATTTIEEGFARLISDFREVRNEPESQRL